MTYSPLVASVRHLNNKKPGSPAFCESGANYF
jgi:hypothetical protein